MRVTYNGKGSHRIAVSADTLSEVVTKVASHLGLATDVVSGKSDKENASALGYLLVKSLVRIEAERTSASKRAEAGGTEAKPILPMVEL